MAKEVNKDSSSTTPELVEDYFGVIKFYSDGSIVRETDIIKQRLIRDTIQDDGSVIWKDCLFDTLHNLHLRIYKPTKNASFSSDNYKLPILYYFQATGFCVGERSYPNQHNSCLSLCSGLQAVVISPDHRLAPEHRLPAAMEDAYAALKWLQDQVLSLSDGCDNWLSEGVDLDNNVFVFGDSSGGNMAHHLAVQLGCGSPELKPIRVRGYIILSPFFGGTVRTKTEEERPFEDFWSQEIYDQLWRLAIPNGADVDHPLVNPFGPKSPSLEGLNLDPFLVIVGGDEVMRDRVEDYAMWMKKSNHKVEYVEFKGKQHGFFASASYLEEAQNVIQLVKHFISQNSSSIEPRTE